MFAPRIYWRLFESLNLAFWPSHAGIAVIVNRPFREGALLRQLARHPLPGWAAEVDCTHWSQVALKFVVSHPAVTCAIPATSQVAHLRQNMAAALGRQPDAALRQRMARDVAAL